MESWITDQLLAQEVCKESLNGDVFFSVWLWITQLFFFNDNLEIVIRSLLVRFQVKSKAEGVGKI